ncbi:MAG: hypothetical protein FD143_2261 [Ignavibacteria bacterium]|nr:MAG: hypothetical protein FD143_2261 [Ignavibacteria bacterium]KAF0158546.1 MAG: hypothetical protein FD188_2546 [Ignavibacteria bacterium]
MINRQLLSICIPTYNRVEFLKESLDSFLADIHGFENEIEILISDNASTDSTKDVVQEYIISYPFIKYYRNAKNVKDENFFIAANLATGEYIWVFADDDKIDTGTLRFILTILRNGNRSVLILNYSIWNKDFSEKLKESFYSISTDMIIQGGNELMKIFGIKIQFISGIIISTQLNEKFKKQDYDQMLEYGFSYSYAIYSSLTEEDQIQFISKPILLYRGYNSHFSATNYYKTFGLGPAKMFENLLFNGYSKKSLLEAQNIVIKDYLITECIQRKLNKENLYFTVPKLFIYYYDSLLFIFIYIPIVFFPNFMLRIIYMIIKRITTLNG